MSVPPMRLCALYISWIKNCDVHSQGAFNKYSIRAQVTILLSPSVTPPKTSEIYSNLHQLEDCYFAHLGARVSSGIYPRSRLLSRVCSSLLLKNTHLLLVPILGLGKRGIKPSPYTQCHGTSQGLSAIHAEGSRERREGCSDSS